MQFTFFFFIVVLPPCLICGAFGNYMLAPTAADEFDPVRQSEFGLGPAVSGDNSDLAGREGGLARLDANALEVDARPAGAI